MNSETMRLRALLDERGVMWDYGIMGATTTRFNVNGVDLTFIPMRNGLVCSTILTPEQVTAATLGPGTCKRVFYEPTGVYVCSECGRGLPKKLDKYCYLNYCPNCGRKVIAE